MSMPPRSWLASGLLLTTLLLGVGAWFLMGSPSFRAQPEPPSRFPRWSLALLAPAVSVALTVMGRRSRNTRSIWFGLVGQMIIVLVQAVCLTQWALASTPASYTGPYSSRREYASVGQRPEDWPNPQEMPVFDLGAGVRLAMPITCFVDAERRTLPTAKPTSCPGRLPDPSVRPLSGQGIANLAAFTRAFGYIRFFHPSDQACSANWNQLAELGVQAAETAENPKDLAARLQVFFSAIAPTARFLSTGEALPPVVIPEGAREVVRWKHTGMGPLPPGSGTFDRATRLGDVCILWTVMQHFYPYFDVVEVDWSAELNRSLARAATDPDERAFLRTLRKLVTSLQDGHGRVSLMQEKSVGVLPIKVRVLEGSAYVVSGPPSLPPGSELLAFNEETIRDRMEVLRQEISSPTEGYRRSILERFLVANLQGPTVRVSYRRADGTKAAVDLPVEMKTAIQSKAKAIKAAEEIRPGIWYLDLSQMDDKAFLAALPALARAKGVIFDIRGYPSLSAVFLQHLSDKPLQSARWNVPIVTQPDRQGWKWNTDGRWELPPLKPRISGKVVFLTGGAAISYAESCLGIIEAYRLGEIIGEPSAGTNGNVNPFELPGGYRVSWTGMKVLKHDGTPHHGVGILPTIPVRPTPEGLAANRDEVLEVALRQFSR